MGAHTITWDNLNRAPHNLPAAPKRPRQKVIITHIIMKVVVIIEMVVRWIVIPLTADTRSAPRHEETVERLGRRMTIMLLPTPRICSMVVLWYKHPRLRFHQQQEQQEQEQQEELKTPWWSKVWPLLVCPARPHPRTPPRLLVVVVHTMEEIRLYKGIIIINSGTGRGGGIIGTLLTLHLVTSGIIGREGTGNWRIAGKGGIKADKMWPPLEPRLVGRRAGIIAGAPVGVIRGEVR